MKYFITLIFIATLAFPAQAQWASDELTPGLHIVFVDCDTCPAFSISADTLTIFSAPRFFRMLDSIAAERGWGAAGGRAFIRDADPDLNALDSTGAVYTGRWADSDEIVLTGTVSWGSADTARISFEGQYGFLTGGIWGADTAAQYYPHRLDWIETNGRGSVIFPPVPPMISALDSAWHINVRKTTTGAIRIDQVTLFRYAPSTSSVPYSPAMNLGQCVAVIPSGAIYGGWAGTTPIINAQVWLRLRRKR